MMLTKIWNYIGLALGVLLATWAVNAIIDKSRFLRCAFGNLSAVEILALSLLIVFLIVAIIAGIWFLISSFLIPIVAVSLIIAALIFGYYQLNAYAKKQPQYYEMPRDRYGNNHKWLIVPEND